MPAAKKKKKKVNGVLFCEADVLSWSCDVSGFGLYNVCGDERRCFVVH